MPKIVLFKKLLGNRGGCPKCGGELDGDNMAAWCTRCDWNNFGTYLTWQK